MSGRTASSKRYSGASKMVQWVKKNSPITKPDNLSSKTFRSHAVNRENRLQKISSDLHMCAWSWLMPYKLAHVLSSCCLFWSIFSLHASFTFCFISCFEFLTWVFRRQLSQTHLPPESPVATKPCLPFLFHAQHLIQEFPKTYGEGAQNLFVVSCEDAGLETSLGRFLT